MPASPGQLPPTAGRLTSQAAGRPFVLPVAASDALLWADGYRNDAYVCLRSPLVPEAVFFGDLPDLASYRPALRLAAHWRRAGAAFMVCRTANAGVVHHLAKFGATATFQDADGRRRYVLPPKGFALWLWRF